MLSKLVKKLSAAWVDWLNYERPHHGVPLCDFERIRYELRPCDVLLIEGRSRVSDIIRSISQSSWSHAALYLGRLHDIEDTTIRELVSSHFKGSPDTQLILEGIMGKGAIVSPLSIYQYDHIRVCRPRGLSRQDAQRVVSHAVQKLGSEYDIRHVVDLARFMLPWRLFPRRFRSKLFMEGRNDKIVCSTMLAEAFSSVDFPILPLVKPHETKGYELITRNPKLYSPRDFDYSPYFDIMKYPYIEFADYAQYRKLPWNREGLVSHDRVGVQYKDPILPDSIKTKKSLTPIEMSESDSIKTKRSLKPIEMSEPDSIKTKKPLSSIEMAEFVDETFNSDPDLKPNSDLKKKSVEIPPSS